MVIGKRYTLEAESVAYLVAKRNGVMPKSETYLSHYAKENVTIDNIKSCEPCRRFLFFRPALCLRHFPSPGGVEDTFK